MAGWSRSRPRAGHGLAGRPDGHAMEPAPSELRPAASCRWHDSSAEFADGMVSGAGGCNSYSATVTSEGGQLLTVGPIAATAMACDEALEAREADYLAALQGATGWRFFPASWPSTMWQRTANRGRSSSTRRAAQMQQWRHNELDRLSRAADRRSLRRSILRLLDVGTAGRRRQIVAAWVCLGSS